MFATEYCVNKFCKWSIEECETGVIEGPFDFHDETQFLPEAFVGVCRFIDERTTEKFFEEDGQRVLRSFVKKRPIDDYKANDVNSCSHNRTPIRFATHDSLRVTALSMIEKVNALNVTREQQGHVVTQEERDFVLVKDDMLSAFRHCQLSEASRPFSVIIVWNPARSRLEYGLSLIKALSFGVRPAVGNFCVVSNVLTTVTRRAAGRPEFGYVDDFVACLRKTSMAWPYSPPSMSKVIHLHACSLHASEANVVKKLCRLQTKKIPFARPPSTSGVGLPSFQQRTCHVETWTM